MERVDANLIPFAKNNPSGYRFAFGTDTATDDINVNYNDNIKKGWGTTPNEFPEVEDFNAMAYTSSYLTAYLYQMGVAEWNNKQNYRQYSRVMGSNGIIYKAKTGTDLAPNVNNNPIADSENWEEEQKLDVVDNIEDLATYSGTGLVMVKDILRGGNFVSKTSIDINPLTGLVYTTDGGTVFENSGVYVFIYDNLPDAKNSYLFILTAMQESRVQGASPAFPKEVNIDDRVGEQSAWMDSPFMDFKPVIDLAWLDCHAVFFVRILGNSDAAISYAQRLNQRLSPLVCR